MLARVLREFACGRAYTARAAFAAVALRAVDAFSTAFFAAHLLAPCLDLCLDPVVNVRLATPALLVAMKRSIRLPEGVEQLERLNSAVSALLTDGDRDVCAAARAQHARFKAVPVQLSGLGGVDATGASKGCAPLACSKTSTIAHVGAALRGRPAIMCSRLRAGCLA